MGGISEDLELTKVFFPKGKLHQNSMNRQLVFLNGIVTKVS